MGKTTIDIDNRQTRFEVSLKMIREIARNILDALDFPDGELSLVLLDDAQITPINQAYLDRNRPTNVIAFPMREGPYGDITPRLLGDVVISLQTTDIEALNAGLPMETRFCQLLVHGILHLFNYDHEACQEDAVIMEKKSKEIIKFIEKRYKPIPHLFDKRMDRNPTPQPTTTTTPIR